MNYFGTSLTEAGHYFWELSGDNMEYLGLSLFKILPFNPEDMLDEKPTVRKGDIQYYRIGEYAIIAIEGSCKDTRWGSKSVFFTNENIKLGELKEKILAIPIAKKIIEQMPFTVNW